MPEWDSQALDVARRAANWWAWCDRHGWDWNDPYLHRNWSRKQFTVALRSMPKDHPERWKYETGARFGDPGQSVWIPLSIFLTVAVIIGSIPLSVALAGPFWIISYPLVVCAWFAEWRARHRALST